MPEIEAAHLGPIPRTALKRAFIITKEAAALKPIMVEKIRRDQRMSVSEGANCTNRDGDDLLG